VSDGRPRAKLDPAVTRVVIDIEDADPEDVLRAIGLGLFLVSEITSPPGDPRGGDRPYQWTFVSAERRPE